MVNMPFHYSPTHRALVDLLEEFKGYTIMATRLGRTTEGMQVSICHEPNGWTWWHWRMPEALWQARQAELTHLKNT